MESRTRKSAHHGGIVELKIAYRSLLKRPIRTIFTIIAITLGVALFFAVNVATDSLEHSLYLHLDSDDFGDANQWVYLFRGILMVLAGISLIICVIIIKNLMEMSKEGQIYEIGLLRAIGSSKNSVFLVFFFQHEMSLLFFVHVVVNSIYNCFHERIICSYVLLY